mgnify:CR=1 FL=1|tara:strand:+ start:10932 stop:12665 length:1734 start_codon:yes stop_codon:yes gene_type:complete
MPNYGNPMAEVRINKDLTSRLGGTPARNQTPAQVGSRRDAYTTNVKALLGGTATLQAATSVNLDLRQGPVHATTGIPYAIGGTATVISQKVGLWLTSFQDPIKAILGIGVHKDERIIIKRKYVVGGSATITPERAPARTVAIQEDVREVSLTRYGGDIEMNLNLFLTDAAEEELEMKVDAQKRELERKLVDLGYDMLMREGTMIMDAIMRSNPAYTTTAGPEGVFEKHAFRIYSQQIFGALNKFRFPIANLLAAARYASAYSTGTQKGSVMIIPHGIPDMLRYTRREKMEYAVSGVQSGKGSKPLTMELDDVYVDTASDIKILVHYPTPTYENGAANPNVSNQRGGLTDITYVINRIQRPSGEGAPVWKTVNLMDGSWVEHGKDDANKYLYRVTKVVASSAILGAPGSQTGELLIGYPFTGCSTSHAEERMRIQLRCYLGAVLYQPDNVLVLPNVFIDGIVGCAYYTHDQMTAAITQMWGGGTAAGGIKIDDSMKTLPNQENPLKDMLEDGAQCHQMFKTALDPGGYPFPLAATWNGKVQVHKNTGEFGNLDDPVRYMSLHGAPQVFENGQYGTESI